MSDDLQDWQEAPAPRRKGPPKWMYFIGCGCLIPGFFLVALVAWGMQFFGTATSPRVAYDALALTLPYDDTLKGQPTGRPDDPETRALESHEAPEFELVFGAEIPFSGGVALYNFVRGASVVGEETVFEDDALVATITKVPTSQSDDVMQSRIEGDMGDPFQLDVQGVTLSGFRYLSLTSDVVVEFPRGTAEVTGPGVSLKLRSDVARDPDDPESKLFDVLLLMQRTQADGAPVTEEEIQHFLAPFHIGPAR
jgi:hypothetical protein